METQGGASFPGGASFKLRSIPYIHPEARALSRENPRLSFSLRSVFERTPGECQVLRTMNILNPSYFSSAQLAEGIAAVFDSLTPGGLWIVGRTMEENFSNHATIFKKGADGWRVLERIGKGWELESFALNGPREPAGGLSSS